ncbi:hypothetical protein DFH11DRAFT_1829264 [Phellopilus nigrolimitatus]|nr:hypothetical protein DFH11DRAFT_1829264 [Phellopilus nigrolimitatus]
MHTARLPYCKLFVHDTRSIALSADGHVQVLDSSTGAILHSTASNAEQKEKVAKSGSIVGASVDEAFTHLVTVTNDKTIRVWEIAGLRVVSESNLNTWTFASSGRRRKSRQKYSSPGMCTTILTSDKFGDVHSYPLLVPTDQEGTAEPSMSTPKKATAAPKNVKRTNDGKLLLGHVSLLTTVLLSKDEKYIVTADRDEHIRVSWYPEAYTIERYCLGHRKFVSALHIPSWEPSLLISGGGDPMLKIWNWMEGATVREIGIADTVVREKPGRNEGGSDDEGDEGSAKQNSRQKRKSKKKAKGKGKEAVEMEEGGQGKMEVDEDGVNEDGDGKAKIEGGERGNDRNEHDAQEQPSPPAPLLAVQKISAFVSASSKFLLFSAHGATALFYCKFPELSDTLSPSPEIHAIALDRPVLDFAIWSKTDEVWVAVDGAWTEDGSPRVDKSESVRIVKVVGDELVLSENSAHQQLAITLNTNLLEATPEMLKKIDLYSALTVLPKNVEAEHNAMEDDAPRSEAASGQLSGKELGRLKTKKAVLARQAALANKRGQSGTPEEDRDVKKKRSEADDAE